MSDAEVTSPEAVLEMGTHVLRTPDDWWTMVLGSGYRATIDQLDVEAQARVRKQCLEFIRSTETRSVEANVIYCQAMKR